jgi:mono/diheme cytochrome c family protein
MATPSEEQQGTRRTNNGLRHRIGRLLRGPLGYSLVLLAIVWLVLPLMPDDSGLRFGEGYRVFFSVIIVAGGLFIGLLGLGPIPQPRSDLGILVSIVLVFVAPVALLVAAGNAYLQFETPSAEEEPGAVLTPEERGEELFWSRELATPCFQCHAIAGRGGTRAPDQSGIGTRAGTRIPGVSAEEYIRGHIREGAGYRFNVPNYPRIMPAFAALISDDDLEALVRFLLSLE